ncbi:hypothetical protein [Hymenobacter nivis]|uniref:Uncharacterized protein n=1 Tax=Hymenobacter nivis TaxID=1850093 RepID=A0A2Z3GTE6_9BACT|nr:hypothetical protein [Hymenobacter nivis]AWM34686.1 hypothetical protein DDQ68_19050 [Hymenobacter nivis]
MVWAWQRAAPAGLPQPADYVAGFRLAIGEVLPQKLAAIAAHRSQVAPGVFTGDALVLIQIFCWLLGSSVRAFFRWLTPLEKPQSGQALA